MVQLPLPANLDKDLILGKILPTKDVDAFTPQNKGLLDNNKASLISCTPKGIIDLLDFYNIDVAKKHVVIVGTSEVVGLPLFKLFLFRKATITTCNINTQDLSHYTKQADILVLATGVKDLVTKEDLKEGSIVINVGIKREGKKIYGDINYEKAMGKVSYITPTPGGVGPLTVLNLLKNTIICYKHQNN